jgi:hypothetical protein
MEPAVLQGPSKKQWREACKRRNALRRSASRGPGDSGAESSEEYFSDSMSEGEWQPSTSKAAPTKKRKRAATARDAHAKLAAPQHEERGPAPEQQVKGANAGTDAGAGAGGDACQGADKEPASIANLLGLHKGQAAAEKAAGSGLQRSASQTLSHDTGAADADASGDELAEEQKLQVDDAGHIVTVGKEAMGLSANNRLYRLLRVVRFTAEVHSHVQQWC